MKLPCLVSDVTNAAGKNLSNTCCREIKRTSDLLNLPVLSLQPVVLHQPWQFAHIDYHIKQVSQPMTLASISCIHIHDVVGEGRKKKP
jgi:hypothetical protein